MTGRNGNVTANIARLCSGETVDSCSASPRGGGALAVGAKVQVAAGGAKPNAIDLLVVNGGRKAGAQSGQKIGRLRRCGRQDRKPLVLVIAQSVGSGCATPCGEQEQGDRCLVHRLWMIVPAYEAGPYWMNDQAPTADCSAFMDDSQASRSALSSQSSRSSESGPKMRASAWRALVSRSEDGFVATDLSQASTFSV